MIYCQYQILRLSTGKLRGLCSRYQALDFLDQFLSDLLVMTNSDLLHHKQTSTNNQAVSFSNTQLW